MSTSNKSTKKPSNGADPSASFRICIALDITGSMGNEIEGCKLMIKNFVQLCDGIELPIELCLMTFTESSQGCYVSSRQFQGSDIPLAVEHVDSWALGVPPDHPNISASGDDGAENQKAALEKLKDLDPLPTILFFVTDAPPHLAVDSSTPTSRAEMRWLQERGLSDDVAGDIFRLFHTVLDYYEQDNLIFNGVVFSGQAQSGIYASMARRTGGLLMEPSSRSATTLAAGLMSVVKALLTRLPGALPASPTDAAPADLGEIPGFNLYDVSQVALRESESDPPGSAPVVGINSEIFRIALDRIVEVCGRKWTKRAIGMSAAAEQLEFVWRTARFVVGPRVGGEGRDRGDLSRLLELREKILAELPVEVRGHFSISERDIEGLADQTPTPGEEGEGEGLSAISLQTVGEALAEDAEWEDWLATVMTLLTGFPVQLQLPKDRSGKPDFADAWSSVTLALGVDRMSASDFMRLLSSEGGGSMIGPTDRHEGYNAFLTLPHPRDPVATTVYKIASGTQVLNYVTGVAMGANGFLPNLAAGCSAACLMRLLSSPTPLSSFQWSQAVQIVHSLRSLHRTPAGAVQKQLANGTANPADSISKLIAALIRLSSPAPPSSSSATVSAPLEREGGGGVGALKLVLEEWMATIIQRFYGKGPESDDAYLLSLSAYLSSGSILLGGDAEIDPLKELHVLEREDAKDAVIEGWEDRAFVRMSLGAEDGDNPAPHPSIRAFEGGARALISLLRASSSSFSSSSEEVSRPDEGTRDLLEEVWPGWKKGLVRSLLLRFRTARYRVRTAPEGESAAAASSTSTEIQWEAIEVPADLHLALGRLKEVHGPRLKSYRGARDMEAKSRLIEAAARIINHLFSPGQQIEGEGEADREARGSEALASLYLHLTPSPATLTASGGKESKRPADAPRGPVAELFGQQVTLDRSSVPLILKGVTIDEDGMGSVLRLLVAGDWTPSPPQNLTKSVEILAMCRERNLDDLLSLILSAEICNRPPPGCNRHGHNTDRQYPGPGGWTLEYSTSRIAAAEVESERTGWARKLRKAKAYCKKMELFTTMANEAIEAARGGALDLGSKVESVLLRFRDANMVEVARAALKELLLANGCFS